MNNVPSEDVMIGRILRYYAGENMDRQDTFIKAIQIFGFDKYMVHEWEIQLLKQRMMEYNLLKSKNKVLRITPHGKDVIHKYGGWEKYRRDNAKRESRHFWFSKTEVWLPIVIALIGLGVAIYSVIKGNAVDGRIEDLNDRVRTLEIDGLKRVASDTIKNH
jgi:hypothetical protein